MKGRFFDLMHCSFAGLRDLFFERSCAVCGGALDSDWHLVCSRCRSDIPLTYFWNYSENAAMERLFDCRVANAAALFFYRHDSPYCEIVRKFKYGRRRDLGLWAAEMLGSRLAGGGLYAGVQAVVPVPLHWLKKWRRGFNQAEIIARGVAEGLAFRQTGAGEPAGSIPVAARLLRRRRYTSTQTRRSAQSRQSNVSGAFALNRREAERLRAAGVTHILIVDDVLTTGSTLKECIRLLQPHFTVSVATLGFVE